MPSSNPLWFGYYPGDRPVVKRPDKRLPTPQLDMSDMGLNAAIDEAINVVGKPAEMPGQLWEWITDDLKTRFLIGASASVQSGEELLQFSREEVADVKGAYISINLADLVTDPKKTITKFIQSSLNPLNPFNALSSFEGEFWTDLDTAQEKQMWVDLLDPPNKKPLLFDETRRSFGPLEFTGQGIYADKTFGSPLAGKDRITGQDIDITLSGAGATDVYENVKKGTLDFVLTRKTALFRNGGYRRMQNSFINAAATELRVRETDIEAALATDPIFGLERGTRLAAFKAEGGLAKTLSKFDDDLESVQKVIAKTGIGAPVDVTRVQDALNALQAKTGTISTQITQITQTLSPLFGERDKFKRDIKELENYVNDVNKVVAKYSGTVSMGRLGGAESMLSEIQQLRDRFSNARYMGGTQDRYLESLGRRYFEGEKSILKFNLVDPTTNKQILSDGFRSISTVYEVQKRAYWQESGRDLVKVLSKGGFSKNYLWFGSMDVTIAGKTIPVGLIRDRIQMFTPGYWTGQIIERTHKFGLVYNEKLAEKGGVLHPIFEKNPLIRTHVFTEKFTANGVQLSAKLTGSKHLGSFYNSWESAKKNQLIGSYDTAMRVTGFGSSAENMQGFFALLNGKGGDLKRSTMGYLGSTGDWEKMVANFKDIRDALINNKLGLHLDPLTGDVLNDAYNQAILGALFREIGLRKAGAATISPFVNKVGALQIYASKLSKAQQEIFTRLKLNKLIDPFIRAKTIVAQRISALLAKVALKLGLRAALDAASGGLAELIAPLIEKVMNAIISVVVDRMKKALKIILKGDLVGAVHDSMDDSMKSTEKAITCGCFVPLFFAFAVIMMMSNILVSISPVDRAKKAISDVVGGIIPPRPEPTTGTDCVFPSYVRTALSYAGANAPITGTGVAGTWRHGSNDYWFPKDDASGTRGIKDCDYNIPYFAGNPASGPKGDSASWCSNAPNLEDYYGYALDIAPAANPDDAWVYAPKLPGVTTWSLDIPFLARRNWYGVGCYAILNGRDTTHNYNFSIFLLHLECESLPQPLVWSLNAGDPVAKLFDYSLGKHVHIEMQVNGVYKKPEDWLCK
jgi:hypothetical protein